MQPSTSSNFLALLNSTGSVNLPVLSATGISSLRDYSPALLSGLGCDKVDGIAGLHRHFNALQLHDTDQIAYKPFHNQLRKQGFPCSCAHWLNEPSPYASSECLPDAHGLAGFEQVLLQDGRHSRYIRNWQNISRADSISTAPLR